MGTVTPSLMEVSAGRDNENGSARSPPEKELDAGALFVLKSQGSWLHCGYHLTTSIVAPVILTLPFALALLGWVGGLICLALAALVTFYSYNLLSLVLEHQEKLGHRQLRFRDMARDILGPGWGKYFVGPLQFWICYGAVIACTLLGGQSLKVMTPNPECATVDTPIVDALHTMHDGKFLHIPVLDRDGAVVAVVDVIHITHAAVATFIYLLSNPDGTMKLHQFIIIFGTVPLVLAQMPSFHSLRHINLVSLILCLAFSTCATAGSIYIGHSDNAPRREYTVKGSAKDRSFGIFNAISIIATTYASGIIPEIQATLAPPVKGKMFKGLCVCYSVIVTTYFSVAISGYWAFGNQAMGTVLSNFMGDGKPLLPTWFLLMTNVFTLLQVSAVAVVYLQPTNEVFEKKFADPKKDQFSVRNVVPRLILRSLSVIVATTFAAMLPFFGDIMALFGAFGCIPLDFILPMIFYNVTFKPSKQSLIFWVNTSIAGVSFLLVGVGAVASVRQIVLDAKTYRLFANM